MTASSAAGDSELPDYHGKWFIHNLSGDRFQLEFGKEYGDPNGYLVTVVVTNPNAFSLVETVKGGVALRDAQRFVRVVARAGQ